MNKKEAADFVIRELSKHHTRNDIIQKICEIEGISWKDAEKFVRQVEAENIGTISLRQSPVVTMTGIITALTGLFVMGWMILETLHGTILLLFYVPYLGNLAFIFGGLAAAVAGIWGIWDLIVKIWKG